MSVYNENISELEDSIDSVLDQSYRNFEFIIISDNPSNYEINNYLKMKSNEDKRIRLIFNDENIGQNLSRNKAVSVSKYGYVAVIDADDLMEKNRLKSQIKFMDENKLKISFSNVSIIDENKNITRKNIYKLGSITNQETLKKILMSHSIVLGPTIMFDRKTFMELDGYRDMNVEDYDLVCRFLVKGKRIGFISESLIEKRLRKNSISFGTLFEQYIIMKSISKYLNYYDAKKEVPENWIKQNVEKINEKQLRAYEKYANRRYSFNDERSFLNFVILISSVLLSKTVLTHTIWTIKNKIVEKYMWN